MTGAEHTPHSRATDRIDMAAHRRIDDVEKRLDGHLELIENLATAIKDNTSSLSENTKLTQEVVNNTAELVELFKGAKAIRKFIIWISSLGGVVYGMWQAIKWFLGR